MTNHSYFPSHGYQSSLMNGSWSEDNTTSPTYVQDGYYLERLRYLQTFPIQIADSIFNIIYVFGILANILLLVYLIYYKRYKTHVFCVILSLGVADLSVCVAAFLWHSCISPFIVGPLWLCNVVTGLINLAMLASSYHIAVFAILRFTQLVYPLTSHAKVTTGLLFKICVAIWVSHSIQSIVITLYVEPVNISPTTSSNIYACANALSEQGQYVFNFWQIIVAVGVPFLTTIGFHVAKQLMVILSHSRSVASQDRIDQQVRRQTDSNALAIVIILYLATMIPIIVQTIRVVLLEITWTEMDDFLIDIFNQIIFTNSAINPWIYLFAAESVRSDIIKMILCERFLTNNSTKRP